VSEITHVIAKTIAEAGHPFRPTSIIASDMSSPTADPLGKASRIAAATGPWPDPMSSTRTGADCSKGARPAMSRST